MDDWRRKAITSLKELHHQACFEDGYHPDEIDTAYSLGADAIGCEAALRARLEAVTQERDEWQDRAAVAVRGRKSAEAALAAAYRMGLEAARSTVKEQQARCERQTMALGGVEERRDEWYRWCGGDLSLGVAALSIRALPVLTPAEILAQIEERGE